MLYLAGYSATDLVMTAVKLSDFSLYYHKNSAVGGSSYNIQKMSYVSSGTRDYIWSCLSPTYFGVMLFDVTNAHLNAGNFTNTYY